MNLEEMEKQIDELKEAFKKREEHQYNDYFKLQRFEEVLRDFFVYLAGYYKLDKPMFYKFLQGLLEKLEARSAGQTERQEGLEQKWSVEYDKREDEYRKVKKECDHDWVITYLDKFGQTILSKEEGINKTCIKCGKTIRLDSEGEKIPIGEDLLERIMKVKSVPMDKSKLREKLPELCSFCGRKLILFNQEWICGHGCTKPALKPKEKTEPKCEYLWQQTDEIKRCTHDRNAQPNMKLDGETPGFCTEDKCPLKTDPNGTDDSKAYHPNQSTEPEKSDALDSLLHAIAPIELPEVNRLLKEQSKELIEEFLEDLKINFGNLTSPYKDRFELLRLKWQGRVK